MPSFFEPIPTHKEEKQRITSLVCFAVLRILNISRQIFCGTMGVNSKLDVYIGEQHAMHSV